jgi:hypothetical protein
MPARKSIVVDWMTQQGRRICPKMRTHEQVAAQVRRSLKPEGTWMVVEPMAGDRHVDDLNPLGRLFYAASTLLCVPTSLAQEVGAAIGAEAGEAKLREAITACGFGTVRRATETPFNMILEARF